MRAMPRAKWLLVGPLVAVLGVGSAGACTRVVHRSKDGRFVVTGRTMDWMEDLRSNLWAFPAGMARDGSCGANSLRWTSKYGSVVTAAFDVGVADGLNTKGLVVNLLYLAETDFGPRDPSRPGISWAAYAQFLLDSYATVAEAVEAERTARHQVVPSKLPGTTGKPPTVHLSLSDAAGDSAILEFLGGKLVIHHGPQYRVMTNSPVYDQQLTLNAYWEQVGGDAMLPGTRRAADRFVRSSFFESRLPDPKTTRQAVANVMAVMRNASVPFGEPDPERPNLSSTLWRTVSDSTSRVYYFESTTSPSLCWVKLDALDLKPGAAARRLNLVDEPDRGGDVTGQFEEAKPFVFTGPAAD